MQTIGITRSLNRTGKDITTYAVFDADSELRTMSDGEVLELLTDGFEPFLHDVEAWCEATGQILRSTEKVAAGYRFLIEKRARVSRDTTLAMVISDAGLEELLSPLGFALGAALEGIDVHLYFQGPATRVLTKGFRPRLKGWSRPFSRFALTGMAKSGHIPPQEKLRQLQSLGAHLYLCGGSLHHFKVAPEDVAFDDVAIIEYLSFMSIMESADIQLYI